MAMKRTQIYLPEILHNKIKIEASKTGISNAELIRLILFEYFKKSKGSV